MKRLMTVLVLVAAGAAHADQKMDIILQQGVSAYEDADYHEAMNHFTAALIYSARSDNPAAYPASYLCAIWYHGRGVEQNRDRARRACQLARGDKSDYQLELFRNALASNASEPTTTFTKALGDAAAALQWYMDETGASKNANGGKNGGEQ